jgi:hypothetical protein
VPGAGLTFSTPVSAGAAESDRKFVAELPRLQLDNDIAALTHRITRNEFRNAGLIIDVWNAEFLRDLICESFKKVFTTKTPHSIAKRTPNFVLIRVN